VKPAAGSGKVTIFACRDSHAGGAGKACNRSPALYTPHRLLKQYHIDIFSISRKCLKGVLQMLKVCESFSVKKAPAVKRALFFTKPQIR
jgi:hypothetical protein